MSEEELELRDLVAQTLENNGILSKIRAELRASVFLALEEQESIMDPAQFTNKPLKAFLSTTEGSAVVCLVREFLEFFKLDFTLAVFDPETSHGKYYNYGGRSKLMKDLHLDNTNGKKGPLLVHILQIALGLNSNSSNVKKDGGKSSGVKNIDVHTPPSVNSFAQSSMLLDTTPPSNARGEKILIPQTFSSSKDNNAVPKANVTFEIKPASSSLETGSKHSLETTVIPKLKDIHILTSVEEEASPRSLSEQVSKSKTSSSEATPCNSPSFSLSKHLQPSSNTESVHHTSKSDSKKDEAQLNKPNVEPLKKAANSGLSSLSNLPPLTGVSFPTKQPAAAAATLPAINKQIKSIIDLGLESQDNNYDEDFNSSASASVKEDPTYQGTDSEIEEELGSGVDDLLSSTSVVDDLTADVSVSNLTGAADYIEDVKLK